MAHLNTTNSLVDFLKSVKHASDFSSRKQIFKAHGLDKRLGNFIGSSSQNNALLTLVKDLKAQGITNFHKAGHTSGLQGDILTLSSGQRIHRQDPNFATFLKQEGLSGAAPTPTPMAAPSPTQAPATNAAAVIAEQTRFPGLSPEAAAGNVAQQARIAAKPAVQAGIEKPATLPSFVFSGSEEPATGNVVGGISPFDPNASFTTTPKGTGSSPDFIAPDGTEYWKVVPKQTIEPTSPEEVADQTPAVIDAKTPEILSDLGLPDIPSATDILDTVLGSNEFKLLQEQLSNIVDFGQATAQAAVQALEKKFAGEKVALEDELASRGLAFSGIRGAQVKVLSDNLAASTLGVDRKLAGKLIDADFKFKRDIINLIADTVQDAKNNRKEAVNQLNKAGLAIVGGQLIPTVGAQTEARQQDRLALDQAKHNLDIGQEEFKQAKNIEELHQAQQRIDISLRTIDLAERKEGRLAGGGTAGGGAVQSTPEIDALARRINNGESVGNIGTLMGVVLARAEEMSREEYIKSVSDPSFMLLEIDQAEAAGDSLSTMRQEVISRGVPPETFAAGLRLRLDTVEQANQTDGFFKRLFAVGGPIDQPAFGLFNKIIKPK